MTRRHYKSFTTEKLQNITISVTHTQDSESNHPDVASSSVREVVDQALVCPCVRELCVVDEDRGTCARHGGSKTHTTT